MKKTKLLPVISAMLTALFAFTVSAADSNVVGHGTNSYTVAVYTSGDKDSGTDANVTYSFNFASGDDLRLVNPKTDKADPYERGQCDTFIVKSNSAMLSALTVTCDKDGKKSDWKIDKIEIFTNVTTPKGKEVKESFEYPIDKWTSEINCYISIIPAKMGGLFYYSDTRELYFEYNNVRQNITSTGLYRVLNYKEALVDCYDTPEIELVYDFTPANQTIFNLTDPVNKVDCINLFSAKLVNVADTFGGGNLEFLNIQTENAKISDNVFTERLKTVGFVDKRINSINVSDTLRPWIENTVINNCLYIPDWVMEKMPNIKRVYLYANEMEMNIYDYPQMLASFGPNVQFVYNRKGAEVMRERYPEYASRMIVLGDNLYAGSVYSDSDDLMLKIGWTMAGIELIVIVGLAVFISRKKRRQ